MDPASRLWVAGTSTVRSFECAATAFDATVESVASDAVAAVLAGEKGVGAVVLQVPAPKMDCGNGKMNEHMLKAIKSEQFPAITFRVSAYDLAKADAGVRVTLNGALTLGGVEKNITVNAVGSATPDGALKVTGKYALKMTEYGLKPPSLMLGTLKVNELVNVNFELLLKPR
jgi:polyisoprenoid-binding protein YceI